MNHIALKSPAKLNLFLHIINQRQDGYHNIQTVFQLINFCDDLTFTRSLDPSIRLITPLMQIRTHENLIYRAAKLLQSTTQTRVGCDITINKRIPLGSGLGGGSSNAATTLLALNKLWNCQLSLDALCQLGSQLGADVPVFIYGHSAWAEGIGERITPMILKPKWYVLLLPKVHINTHRLYQSDQLKRDCTPLVTAHYPTSDIGNVFEPVVRQQYPLVNQALEWLSAHGEAKLTGTGAAVFAAFDDPQKAGHVARLAQSQWPTFLTEGLNHSPVHAKLCAY